jgi:hypothetical protein
LLGRIDFMVLMPYGMFILTDGLSVARFWLSNSNQMTAVHRTARPSLSAAKSINRL